jgi:hypothetical protein
VDDGTVAPQRWCGRSVTARSTLRASGVGTRERINTWTWVHAALIDSPGGPWASWAALQRWAGLINSFLFYSNLFQFISKDQLQKYKTQPSISPKKSNLGKVADKFKAENFPFWPNIKISLDFEL